MTDERKDLPPVNSPNFLEKVREALSVYLGNRGSGLDRGVTLRDLSEAGLVELRKGFGTGNTRNPIGGAGSLITSGAGGSGAGEVYEPDLTPPPTPTGFTAAAGITNLLLECDPQTYTQGHGHAKSKLYGATWTAGPLPVFADAVVITEFSGPVASHATNPATTWHLWLTWVTEDGVESTTAAGGTNGVMVRTGEDVTLLVEAMTGPGNPFTVLDVETVVDGVTFPAGTYSTRAFIQDAQITNAKIGNAAIDDAKVASLSAAKLTAGSIGVGSYISSTAYTAGSAGWRINADGTAEFSGVVVRGTVYATAGQIGGITVASNAVRAGQTAFNTGTGFYLGANGTFSLGNSAGNRLTWDGTNLNVVSPGLTLNNGAATFSGALAGASGTFSGELQAATGSFAGTLQAGTVDVSTLIGTTATYLSPGTYNFTIPAGSNLLKVTLVGGGGGGGAVQSIATVGTGGGGGGFTQASFSVSQGQVYTLVVGAGGAVGAAGGATYVSGVASAGGGGAGKTNGAFNTTLAGPSGGSGTVNGAVGGSAVYGAGYMQGGAGGNSAVNYGLGGAGSYYDDSTIIAPSAGSVYGGGGGGGFNSPGVSRASLAGAHGRAVIEVSNSSGVIIRSEWLTLTAALQRQGIAIT